jgi:four helix bundle protein
MGELRNKSYDFAIRIVKLNRYLITEQKEFVLSKQVLRSGTAIGALIRESEFGQSKADFINKLSVGLKEANETEYWLSLIHDTNFIENKMYVSMKTDIDSLISMLVASIKTAKGNLGK